MDRLRTRGRDVVQNVARFAPERAHVSTTLKGIAAATAVVMVASCSSYSKPFADIAIAVRDSAERDALLQALETFARQNNLHSYRASELSVPNEPSTITRRKEHTVYYVRRSRNERGFELTIYEASPQCLVVRLFESDRAWSSGSLASLEALRGLLTGIAGERVRIMSAPSSEWKSAAGEMEEYCVRMGLPDPRSE